MAKNNAEVFTDKILVVHCKPLDDPWECECDRVPFMMVDRTMAKKYYSGFGYEWYAIKPNGALHRIKEYDKK